MLLKLFLCRRSQTFEHVRMDSLIGIWSDTVWLKYLVFCRIEKTLTLWMDYIAINHMKTFLSSLNRMMSWQKILTNDVNIAPGGTPLNKLYRYLPAHRVGFLRRFGPKTGMVFKGTTRVYERIYQFNSKWVRKKEKRGTFRKGFEEFFSLCSNLSKDKIISALRPSLKTVVENYILWSEIRSGFREPGGHTLTKDSKEYPQGEYRRRRCPFEIIKLLIEHMDSGKLDLP